MKEQIAAIGVTLLQALSPAILALIGLIGVKLTALLQAKIKNATLQGILSRLTDTTINAVKEVEQTYVSNLPANATADDFAKAKQMALDTIKAHMGPKGLAELQNILGLSDPAAVDKYIVTILESRVHDLNASTTTTPAGGAK